MRLILSLALGFIQISSAGLCHNTDWPGWRGPDRNGISLERDWNPLAITEHQSILWEVQVGKGHASVAVVDGRVFTTGNIQTDGIHTDIVICLDLDTGKEIWRYSYPSDDVEYPGPRATPCIDEGSVYTLSWQGWVHCLDANTGNSVWSKNLVQAGLAEIPSYGFSASPVVEGNLLILNAGSLGLALNKLTGDVVWKSAPKAGTLPTPLVFSHGGKRYATFPKGRALYAVDLETGKPAWWYPWYKDLDIDPIFLGDRLFLPGYKGSKLLSVHGEKYEVLMENRKVRFNAYQNAVALSGHIYGFTKAGNKTPLQCVDMNTGELKWKKDLGLYGSLSAADGKLIIITGDGKLSIAEAFSSGLKEIASTQVLTRPDNASLKTGREWICWTQPVLAHGRIFVRSNYGDLVCVDVRR